MLSLARVTMWSSLCPCSPIDAFADWKAGPTAKYASSKYRDAWLGQLLCNAFEEACHQGDDGDLPLLILRGAFLQQYSQRCSAFVKFCNQWNTEGLLSIPGQHADDAKVITRNLRGLSGIFRSLMQSFHSGHALGFLGGFDSIGNKDIGAVAGAPRAVSGNQAEPVGKNGFHPPGANPK